MKLQISKGSEVPVREQLTEQIIFLIATDGLRPGQPLPSIRELARRLKIHRNTVSRVYADLVRRAWLTRRRGARVLVRSSDELTNVKRAEDIDILINAVIRVAREGGYTLQSLRARVRERLLAEPPDHILVVEDESGLRRLIQEEIREVMRWPLAGCSQRDLAGNAGLGVGALLVSLRPFIAEVDPFAPKDRPPVPITFASADEQVRIVSQLTRPSVVAVVSVSEAFLTAARGLLAPVLETRHTLCEFLLPIKESADLGAADLVLCDTIAFKEVRHQNRACYRLISKESLDYLASAMAAYQRK
jgi:DNA-binding transcriptional regulator YhcF (GntR family)